MHHDHRTQHEHARARDWRSLPLTLLVGACALIWLLVRTVPKPSRLTYPCQQAAFSAASLIFGGALVSGLVALRRRLGLSLFSPRGLGLSLAGLALTLGVWGIATRTARPSMATPRFFTPASYMAQVYHQSSCPQNPVGDRFPGLDELIEKMGADDLKFYRSEIPSLVAGPEGIVGSDDVVLIKINYQWSQRGGTNTDLLRGLLRRIVDHPDGFTGEVVIGENAQFALTENFDRAENNAQNISQSPHDVVAYYQSLGDRVSHFDWTPMRNTQVQEYDQGSLMDGYIVYGYDAQLAGRISYPKFRTSYGTYISLRNGIWTSGSGYDRPRLKILNLPVLKSHHSTYGATVATKNWMGVVTGYIGTKST